MERLFDGHRPHDAKRESCSQPLFRLALSGDRQSGAEKTSPERVVGALVSRFGRVDALPVTAAENAWKSSQREYGISLATAVPQ